MKWRHTSWSAVLVLYLDEPRPQQRLDTSVGVGRVTKAEIRSGQLGADHMASTWLMVVLVHRSWHLRQTKHPISLIKPCYTYVTCVECVAIDQAVIHEYYHAGNIAVVNRELSLEGFRSWWNSTQQSVEPETNKWWWEYDSSARGTCHPWWCQEWWWP